MKVMIIMGDTFAFLTVFAFGFLGCRPAVLIRRDKQTDSASEKLLHMIIITSRLSWNGIERDRELLKSRSDTWINRSFHRKARFCT